MKAIVQDRYGTPDVLEFRDIEEPSVGENDVLIRVHAAGSGPDVWHIMAGLPLMARPMLGFGGPKIPVRGWDVAGIVEAVGGKVTEFHAGDEVMGVAEGGSFAELAVTQPKKLVHKPAGITFEQAAAVPVSGATALQALRDKGEVRSGQKVLVIGAAGGVGTFAVQIAKAFGAEVTGVSSTDKMDLVRSIGADELIDYTTGDFLDGTRRWDLIVDTAGRRPLRHLRRGLSRHGTLVVVGGDGGGRWTGGFFRGMLRGPIVSLFVGQKLQGLNAKTTREDLETLRELIETGKITPVVGKTYALADAPEAVREIERGHARGKLVITVQSS